MGSFMSTGFVKYTRIPHLSWTGAGKPRGDRLMGEKDRREFLDGELVVEEKVDGANVGVSLDMDTGRLRAQSRGDYLRSGRAHPQFEPMWKWLAIRQEALADILGAELILYGEWCYAVHTIYYDRLPDWFLGFDVYDRSAGRYWSSQRRDQLIERAGLDRVPLLGRGKYTQEGLEGLMAESKGSQVGAGPMEGLILRRDEGPWLGSLAKLVRVEFLRSMDDHWRSAPLRPNQQMGQMEFTERATASPLGPSARPR